MQDFAFRLLCSASGSLLTLCRPEAERWLPSWIATIDQGWATVVAAFLGFCALVWQTRVGYRNLRESSAYQSEEDRKARLHQAELQRLSDLQHERRAAQSLAGALAGELTYFADQVPKSVSFLIIQRNVYRAIGDNQAGSVSLENLLPRFDPLIYRANAGQLGALGPSLANDVTTVYSLINWRPVGPAADLTGNMMAVMLDGCQMAYQDWLLDQMHVHRRLLAFYAGQADVGTLYQNRLERVANQPAG